MKYAYLSTLLITLVVGCSAYGQEKTIPDVQGLYLGQKPPGMVAELFAPGIVSTKNWEAFATFSPNLKEIYFGRGGGQYKEPTLVVLQYKDKRWSESVFSPLVGEPVISPDGKTMYLGNRYKERIDGVWSESKSLGSPYSDIPIMRLTASASGTFVFDEKEEIGTIRYSRLIVGKRDTPKAFSKEINTGKWTAHPFIAPDESYLIWDSEREGGYGGTDLYISFRQEDGSWGSAINMGEGVNTKHEETYASVTPDGKYLFFHTYMEDGMASIFWVDAQVIEQLREK